MPETRLPAKPRSPSRKSSRESSRKGSARGRLLDAARTLIRRKGYSATTVDELCAAAGVTKGAFFHHFPSKEALGVAAAEHWSRTTGESFASAPYHEPADPLDRILAYIDFRSGLLDGRPEDFSCLAGTMLQEVYGSSPAIRAACDASICDHAATLEDDLEAVIARSGVAGVTAKSLALHTQAVLQGAFVLAKGKEGSPGLAMGIAKDSAAHLRRYIELLFRPRSESRRNDT